ncbi:fumarylacetoacetate hydrolase family protein [Paralcaligenes ureilyticus]|uniref:2-keto-4-pentenoate hydratase/2-oxohepta-3-ene-1,7-dioic acid hydratase in catechol pathway n=1 Tax=Paralcaligenes ureilyticus TaxID=627131 RepID=A0A4R3M7I2_9BURK|nr:fumarylacetoacetate hydrolase family protein [Paralcaligenes ureilyticus]TCT09424.1 2-keto-4-pentenoate hydratase/2-oxohepta-3-ene-1,7-dioic acid hydratase in catechol pathway [Paralcaligenes ureilyticus]
MRLVSYIDRRRSAARSSFGAVVGTDIVELAWPGVTTLRQGLLAEGMQGLSRRLAAAGQAPSVALADVELLAPVADPGKILCIGLNYHLHAQEVGMAVPSHPSVFARFPSSLVGAGQPVVRPVESEKFDYEAELAVVIGRAGRRIPVAAALDYVAGYSCLAENSVRDWQRHSNQATPGKNFPASGAFGPWLVSPDEAGPLEDMTVIGRLNGAQVQSDTVAHMIFSVPELIAYVSTFTELEPGDVISTGTPAGVGLSRKPPLFLKSGDVFEVEISGVGVLRNSVIDEC